MKNTQSFFYQLDQWMFTQVERLQQSMPVQKWNELVASFEETQQKYVHQAASLILTFVPLALVVVIMATNCSMRSEIEDKKAIIRQIDRLNLSREQFDQISRPILAAVTLADEALLQQRLKVHLERDNIAAESITVSEFNTFPLSAELLQTQATISFKTLSLTDFTNLLTSLIQREKMILVDIDVNRDEKTEFLQGSMTINSFGKSKR